MSELICSSFVQFRLSLVFNRREILCKKILDDEEDDAINSFDRIIWSIESTFNGEIIRIISKFRIH